MQKALKREVIKVRVTAITKATILKAVTATTILTTAIALTGLTTLTVIEVIVLMDLTAATHTRLKEYGFLDAHKEYGFRLATNMFADLAEL